MATVNWTSNIYGFDFRKMLLSYVSPTFGGTDPTSFQVLDIGPGGYGPAKDTYYGSFTYGVVSDQVSGTVTSITRQENDFTSTVSELSIQVSSLQAVATTPGKEDDLQVWAVAFLGDDHISGAGSGDYLEGFAGNDVIASAAGNDTLNGGTGADYLSAGHGNDTVYGAEDADTLLGEAGNDWLDGGFGLDALFGGDGNDSLYGQSDRDLLTGGRGADKLYGGGGNDAFIFASIKDSTVKSSSRDTIYDFSSRQKDKIDLKAIDASTKSKGNQSFKFIDKQNFHKKAGELQWEKVKSGVYVYGDTNGDGKTDFSIFLKGLSKISKGDFFL